MAKRSYVIYNAYDDTDGNQTRLQTVTGEWTVAYNALNQATCFTQGSKRVECRYDYLNRRVEKAVYEGETLMSKKRFIYNGYLQIAELDAMNATDTVAPVLRKTYLWDPLEPIATRVLAMSVYDETGAYVEDLYFTHDALKNTTALFGIQAGRRALYEYGPYGSAVKMEGNAAELNPFRFSSEYFDEETELVQYNFRYYNSQDGRWIGRDLQGENVWLNRYNFVNNAPTLAIDLKGEIIWIPIIIAVAVAGSLSSCSVDSKGVEASNAASVATTNDNIQPSRVEYCGCICRHKYLFTLIYTGPVRGNSTARSSSCQPLDAPCPSCYTMVGSYHSHTARSNYGPFSEADLNFARHTNAPIYVGRGYGNVDRADPNGDITIITRD